MVPWSLLHTARMNPAYGECPAWAHLVAHAVVPLQPPPRHPVARCSMRHRHDDHEGIPPPVAAPTSANTIVAVASVAPARRRRLGGLPAPAFVPTLARPRFPLPRRKRKQRPVFGTIFGDSLIAPQRTYTTVGVAGLQGRLQQPLPRRSPVCNAPAYNGGSFRSVRTAVVDDAKHRLRVWGAPVSRDTSAL